MVTNILMAVRPAFADAILDGSKLYEIRRRRPGFAPGSAVWIYATRPAAVIVGGFEAGDVSTGSPAELWRALGKRLGLTRPELDNYLGGSDVGYAIEVRRPQRLLEPIRLGTRSDIPQSYRYLGRRDGMLMEQLHGPQRVRVAGASGIRPTPDQIRT